MSLPFTQVQTKTATNSFTSTSQTITFNNSVVSGNTILLVIGISSSIQTITSITDSVGNTYTNIDAGTNSISGALYYVKNANGGSAITITVNLSASTGQGIAIIAAEYTGLNASRPLDVHATTTGNSATIGTGTTGVTAYPSELVVAWGAIQSSTPSFSLGAGFGNLVTASTSVSVALEDKTATTTTTQTGTFSNSSNLWVGGIAALVSSYTKPFTIRPHVFSPGIAR